MDCEYANHIGQRYLRTKLSDDGSQKIASVVQDMADLRHIHNRIAG